MANLRTEVLHEPKLDTILMVEKAIINATSIPQNCFLEKFAQKMQYQTFKRILDYLEASGKISFDRASIIYTGVNNPKLEALIKSRGESLKHLGCLIPKHFIYSGCDIMSRMYG